MYRVSETDNFAVINARSEEEARERFAALDNKGTIISIQESVKTEPTLSKKLKEWKCKKCGGMNLQGFNSMCIHCQHDPQKKFRENLGKELEESRRLIDDN